MLSGGLNLIKNINISSVVELIDDGEMREGSGGSVVSVALILVTSCLNWILGSAVLDSSENQNTTLFFWGIADFRGNRYC